MFSFLCPKLFWTVHDETLYKGLSSNEFLRGRIPKFSPFSFLFFSFSYLLFAFSNVFFSLLSSYFNGSMAHFDVCVCGGGCPSDNTGKMGSQC